jgi:hypothetical protein
MVQLLAFGRRGEIPPSSHVLQLLTRPDQAVEVAAGLFSGDPFPHRDRCAYLGPADVGKRIAGRLGALGVRVADLLAAGQLLLLPEPVDVVPDDHLGPYALIADHIRMLGEARRDGFAGVRLVIDMARPIDPLASPTELLKYEAVCDAVFVFAFHRLPIVAIAQYDAARLGERLASDLVKLHPFVYLGRSLKHNPDYRPQGPEPPGPAAPSASRPRPRGQRTGDTAVSA